MSSMFSSSNSLNSNIHITPCNCIGPQNGEPMCPCRMRDVMIKDGRYMQIHDLGPAPGQTCLFDGLPLDSARVCAREHRTRLAKMLSEINARN